MLIMILFQVACSVGHVIKRRVELLSRGCYLTGECVQRWVGALKRSLTGLAARASALSILAARLADTARALDIVALAAQQIKAVNIYSQNYNLNYFNCIDSNKRDVYL